MRRAAKGKIMEKTVIVINGNGGVGKDTLCNFVSQKYKVKNVSAIDPVKDIAWQCGWRGEKDPKSRKFLADLKKLIVDYSDYPYIYLIEEYEKFRKDDAQILFVHIREGEEIEKFKKAVRLRCITLLIRRQNVQKFWGNESDDNVERYAYDYYYDNDKILSETKNDFLRFFEHMIYDDNKKGYNNEIGNNLFSQDRLASSISNWYLQDKKLLQKEV